MQIQITYTKPASTPEKAETYRITVRSASYVDRAHYFSLAREAGEWYTQRTGLLLEDDTDDAEFVALRNLCFYRAEMLCAVDRERTADGTIYMAEWKNGSEGAAFERKAIPADWLDLDGMADNMPASLLDEWLDATRELNAGVLATVPDRFLATRTTRIVLD